MHKLSWAVLLLLATLSLPAAPSARPRVGLVLEGGGALGFAHIGVIDYLEQHHIPVDLVVGTSMGGLVGGLYAVGQSPAEIRELTQRIDWDAVLSGRTAFQYLNFRRKEDRIAFPNPLELGLRHKKLNLPAGLNSGHQTGMVIDRATLAYHDNLNFDDFPIPFRCVATDLSIGREKVFASGSIAQALRATMAIPAVFSPVVIDGHVYTDGGAVDNLPVDVARRAGADIVIAVYLDPGPVDPASYDSMFAVAARNISIMVSANELRNMAAADILISVDLHGFTSSSFTDGKEIAPKGYTAAEKKQQMLARIALNESDWKAHMAAREAKTRRLLPVPKYVEVLGQNTNYTRALSESLSAFVGKPVDPPAIETELNRFVGNGVMSSIGYTMAEKGGEPGLEVKTYEKTYGPPFLNLGLSIDGSSPNNVLFGLSARLTLMNLGGYRAEWRSDAYFGSTYGASTEYFRPFSAESKWFVAPRLFAVSSPFNQYSGRHQLYQYRFRRLGLGGDLGYSLNARSELRFGHDLIWFKALNNVGDPFSSYSARENVSSVKFRYFGVDNVQIPRSGSNIETSVSRVQQNFLQSFEQLQLRASFFQPIGEKSSIFITGTGGTAFNTGVESMGLQFFTLGGPFQLGAYGQNQLLGNQFFLFQGGYERKLLGLSPFLGEGVYALSFVEVGKAFGYDNHVPRMPLDGSLALAARTALGPVFIGFSVGNGGYRKWWFGVGRIF